MRPRIVDKLVTEDGWIIALLFSEGRAFWRARNDGSSGIYYKTIEHPSGMFKSCEEFSDWLDKSAHLHEDYLPEVKERWLWGRLIYLGSVWVFAILMIVLIALGIGKDL